SGLDPRHRRAPRHPRARQARQHHDLVGRSVQRLHARGSRVHRGPRGVRPQRAGRLPAHRLRARYPGESVIALLAVIALTGATLLTGDGARIQDATVVIDGTRILQVGRNLAVPSGAQVVNVAGSVITPGFIDPATRLGVVEVPGGEPSAVEGT